MIAREKSNDPQLDLFEGEKFKYHCILTNKHKQTEKEVIEYYNQRGSSEKTFDIQFRTMTSVGGTCQPQI